MGPWLEILRDEYVNNRGMLVNYKLDQSALYYSEMQGIFQKGTYSDIFGVLQFIIAHEKCPRTFKAKLDRILTMDLAAYRIVGGDTLVPVGSSQENEAITAAFRDTKSPTFQRANTHLKQAAAALTAGKFADSVRESIHAVEAIARTLEPSVKLSKALAKLENSTNLHGAMKYGFNSLYGYTSDEGGIRHALLEGGDANVDEADAMFMIGACASFVTYLIAKKRVAGLSDSAAT